MLVLHKDQSLTFSIFDQFPNLVCRYSTRVLGDLNIKIIPREMAERFLAGASINPKEVLLLEQIHSAQITLQANPKPGDIFAAVDGVVSNAKNRYFGIRTADCVPLFFYDAVTYTVAIAHAGWRGTLLDIAHAIIKQMQGVGSQVKDIYVGIGPHIGACCYNVPQTRAQDFKEKYGQYSLVVYEQEKMYFLDIGQANRLSLLEAGILPNHIDWSVMCTSCQHDLFFSFRKDTKETFGQMLGVIGIKS